MSIITGKIKGLLEVKPKTRFDSYTDQFHRVFMVKMSMVSSLLLGMNWIKDTMSCIIPSHHGIDKKFTSQACWIQGFFVYKELRHIPGMFGYYGIPKDFDDNGYYPAQNIYEDPEPCRVGQDNRCLPYTKTFFLQYQWFPFYIAAIGLLFYLPYILFRSNNGDIMSLKTNLKAPGDNVVKFVGDLLKNYFNQSINTARRMKMKVFINIFIKVLYIITNVIAFAVTNGLLHGEFSRYGTNWLTWSKQPNEKEYDYTSAPEGSINPASVLLPTFGLCEVLELGQDIKHTIYNKHQFVCEISQNVLYQYVLLLLWFLFVFGLIISIIGLLMEIGDHLLTWYAFMVLQGDQTRKVYTELTLRECHYLEHIRKKDMAIYGEVIRQLKRQRIDPQHTDDTDDHHFNNTDNHADDTLSSYPHAESRKLLNEM